MCVLYHAVLDDLVMMKSEGKQRLNHRFRDWWFQRRLMLWAWSQSNSCCSKVGVWIWHGAQIPKNICRAAVVDVDQWDPGKGWRSGARCAHQLLLRPSGCLSALPFPYPGSLLCPGSDVNREVTAGACVCNAAAERWGTEPQILPEVQAPNPNWWCWPQTWKRSAIPRCCAYSFLVSMLHLASPMCCRIVRHCSTKWSLSW